MRRGHAETEPMRGGLQARGASVLRDRTPPRAGTDKLSHTAQENVDEGVSPSCRSGASRTRTQNIADDGYQGDPIDGLALGRPYRLAYIMAGLVTTMSGVRALNSQARVGSAPAG